MLKIAFPSFQISNIPSPRPPPPKRLAPPALVAFTPITKSKSRQTTLTDQRPAKILSTVFKIVIRSIDDFNTYEAPVSLLDIVHLGKSSYNLRGTHISTLPKVNSTTYGLRSWRYTSARLWNSLPNKLKTVTSYKSFTTKIRELDLSGL